MRIETRANATNQAMVLKCPLFSQPKKRIQNGPTNHGNCSGCSDRRDDSGRLCSGWPWMWQSLWISTGGTHIHNAQSRSTQLWPTPRAGHNIRPSTILIRWRKNHSVPLLRSGSTTVTPAFDANSRADALTWPRPNRPTLTNPHGRSVFRYFFPDCTGLPVRSDRRRILKNDGNHP